MEISSMKWLLAIAVPALPFSTFGASPAPASADAWQDARPAVDISVSRGEAPDTYQVNAVVSDLRNGDVLAKPIMVIQAGKAARAEIGGVGMDGFVSVAFAVTVDPTGETAAYTSEVRNNAEVVSSQSATLAVVE
jgi:hypothetical protein